MTYYSALHYAAKAEKSATSAANSAQVAQMSAANAEEAKNLANEAVSKLGEFDSTVDNAKEEIVSLSTAEQAMIATAANGVKDVAVSEINSAKDVAVDEVEQAGATISSFQFPIIPITQSSGNVSVDTNTIYQMTISDSAVFVLPTDVNTGVFNQIKVMAQIVGTPTIDWGTSYFFNKTTPEIEEGYYDVYFDYDNLLNTWVCGVISKGVSA